MSRKRLGGTLAIALFLSLAGCSNRAADCGSPEATTAVLRIAKGRGAMLGTIQASLFAEYAKAHGEKIAKARAATILADPPKYVYNSPPPMWCRDKSNHPTWADYHARCFDHNPTVEEIAASDPGEGTGAADVLSQVQEEMNHDISNSYMQENITYSLDTIRTIAKDHDTGAASCVAELHAALSLNDKLQQFVKANSWTSQITYKLEITSDDKLYVTLLSKDVR